MENKRNRRVLVTGAGGPSGKAAIAALKAREFFVVAVDMTTTGDHLADEFFLVPAARDPAFIPRLVDMLREWHIDWLFPTVSEELVVIAPQAPALRREGIAVYMAPAEAVRTCDDKWDTANELREAGVAVPRSAVGAPDSAAVQSLGFPCISKPRVGRGGRGVTVHHDPQSQTQVTWQGALWQEFMPGKEYDVLLVVHPDAPHEVVARQVFIKTELREGLVGNAVSLEPIDEPDVAALAVAAAHAVGLRGPADMDIRRDTDGIPRLLEINARIGAHTLRAPQIFDALVSLYERGHLG